MKSVDVLGVPPFEEISTFQKNETQYERKSDNSFPRKNSAQMFEYPTKIGLMGGVSQLTSGTRLDLGVPHRNRPKTWMEIDFEKSAFSLK